jgi:hypothetical protein
MSVVTLMTVLDSNLETGTALWGRSNDRNRLGREEIV